MAMKKKETVYSIKSFLICLLKQSEKLNYCLQEANWKYF